MRRELVATVDVDLPACCGPTEWAPARNAS